MIGISHSSEKRAIIDIGSNTVRMVVYNGPPRAPVVILNEKVNARLGRDLGKTGAINDKSMKTALVALARFSGLLRLLDVKDVECVATAAARDASNGKIFLDAVRQFGLSPRLLSGEEEARASATGVIAAFPGAHGVAADLGGGSLELVEIAEGRSTGGITLPFGTLLLPDLRAAGESRFSETVIPMTPRAAASRSTSSADPGAPWRFRRCARSTSRWTIPTASSFPPPKRCASRGSLPRASSMTWIRAFPPAASPPCPMPPR
jgi:hypothetical protein